MRSVRPSVATLEGEIVRIGHPGAGGVLGREHLVGDAMALAIGDRFLGRIEAQPDLLGHIAGARPTHQRLDLARLLRLEVEHLVLGLGGARLHRGLRRLVDSCDHGSARLGCATARSDHCRHSLLAEPFARRTLPAEVLVGAAGFEPATWSTQNSRATRLRYTPRGCRPTAEPLDTRFA